MAANDSMPSTCTTVSSADPSRRSSGVRRAWSMMRAMTGNTAAKGPMAPSEPGAARVAAAAASPSSTTSAAIRARASERGLNRREADRGAIGAHIGA